MRAHALPYLCCPDCHAVLVTRMRSRAGDAMHAGTLACPSCRATYQVFHGRPILMRDGDAHQWVAPIDEALEPATLGRPQGPLSLTRLRDMGVDQAIEVARQSDLDGPLGRTGGIMQDLKSMEGAIRYRQSGAWLRRRCHHDGFLKSVRSPRPPVREFVSLVLSEKPVSVLDVVSGGGSGVVSLADAVGTSVQVFAAERDLKCLWTIQSKFAAIGGSDRAEAVGADVRRLPFRDGSIAVVTSMMGLQELLGIDHLLTEIARVLRPGGSYVALYDKEPRTYGFLSLSEYRQFGREVGMYTGHDDFEQQAQRAGLRREAVRLFCENGNALCLTLFRNGNPGVEITEHGPAADTGECQDSLRGGKGPSLVGR